MIRFIDLFCGLGGFRIALKKQECVFSCDNDKSVSDVYYNNFNENPFSDIQSIHERNIPKHDILCAGFPCQPFSIAGKRKGFDDSRGTLFFDILRILNYHKPKAFILENVKGLVNHDNGNTFKIITESLSKSLNGVLINSSIENLGYNVFYKVLNSKDYGIPQNRERIFIVGFKNNCSFEFPEKESLSTHLKDILDINLPDNTVSETENFNILKNLEKHKKREDIINNDYSLAYEIRKSKCTFRWDGISPCLTAKMGTGGNNIPVLIKNMRRLSVKECMRIQGFPDSYLIPEGKQNSYKQIGNSISIPLVKKITDNIIKQL